MSSVTIGHNSAQKYSICKDINLKKSFSWKSTRVKIAAVYWLSHYSTRLVTHGCQPGGWLVSLVLSCEAKLRLV